MGPIHGLQESSVSALSSRSRPSLSGFIATLALLLATVPTPAAAQALDPMNRVHLGVSLVEGPSSFGVTGGLDSRLTKLVFVDAGGFISPQPLPSDALESGTPETEAMRLRHGIFIAPGVRIPHVQPRAFSFDVLPRGGAAAVWVADLASDDQDYRFSNEVAGFVGGDLNLQRNRLGLRLSYRLLFFAPFINAERANVPMNTPLASLEAQYQFGGQQRR